MTPQRSATIDVLRSQAERLLKAVHHPTARNEIRIAIRDLEEAVRWLKQEGAAAAPYVLRMADLSVQLAGYRLNRVQEALNRHGPEAALSD